MLTWSGIHLNLHAFDVRPVLRVHADNSRMQKNTRVAIGLAFELKPQIKIAIRFLTRQIAVLVSGAFPDNRALLDSPFLVTINFPAA